VAHPSGASIAKFHHAKRRIYTALRKLDRESRAAMRALG
jgi:hypothetical protein